MKSQLIKKRFSNNKEILLKFEDYTKKKKILSSSSFFLALETYLRDYGRDLTLIVTNKEKSYMAHRIFHKVSIKVALEFLHAQNAKEKSLTFWALIQKIVERCIEKYQYEGFSCDMYIDEKDPFYFENLLG